MRFTDPTEAWKTEIKRQSEFCRLCAIRMPGQSGWVGGIFWQQVEVTLMPSQSRTCSEVKHYHPGTLTIIASKTLMRLHVQTTSPDPYEDEDSSAPNAYHQCSARFLAD